MAMVAIPLAIIFLSWLTPASEVWQHLAETILPELLRNTLVLMIGVGSCVLVLGVGMAWLTVMYDFPGRRWFDWALMLPLAIPAYVLAFVYLGLFEVSGPIQGVLNASFGLPYGSLPNIRSDFGIVLVMSLVLYPYVYMLARVAFLGQGTSALESARALGLTSTQAFYQVALPMARPAIVAGLSLALMETLADFGAVSVFNYDTFTTAIYEAWFGLFNLQAAAQLASLLLLFVTVLLLFERTTRYRARYHGHRQQHRRQTLGGWRGAAASSFLGLIFILAFVLPVAQLAHWVWSIISIELDPEYVSLLLHTVSIGSMALLVTLCGAFVLSFTRKFYARGAIRRCMPLANLGYALPGSVLAIGIMLSFTWIDRSVVFPLLEGLGLEPRQLLTGSLLALILAYFVRFLSVAYGPIDAALERVKPVIHESARSLGASQREIIRLIYLPILRPGFLAAALLVLVDVMKEMPATLLLRPFDWDTLAVRIYELTSEGEWERAALPALTLVLVGLAPVIMLVRQSERSGRS